MECKPSCPYRDRDSSGVGMSQALISDSPEPSAMSDSHHQHNAIDTSLFDLLQGFQTSMEKQFIDLSTKLSGIDARMDNMEERQRSLETQMKNNPVSSSSCSTTPDQKPTVRRRVTPISLQVCGAH